MQRGKCLLWSDHLRRTQCHLRRRGRCADFAAREDQVASRRRRQRTECSMLTLWSLQASHCRVWPRCRRLLPGRERHERADHRAVVAGWVHLGGVMRLLWKKYDSSYDPFLLLHGVFYVVGGSYMLFLIGSNLEWTIWLLRCIPLTFIAMGITIIVRQMQLRSKRTNTNN